MRAQRVREGESRAEMQSAKWTAEGTVKGFFIRVLCDVRAYVSCRGYEGIPLSAQGHSCEFKVAPRILYFCMIRP